MKKALALVLSLVMVLSMSISASAKTFSKEVSSPSDYSKMSNDEIDKEISKNIKIFEKEIESNGSTVLKELSKSKGRFEAAMKSTTNTEDKASLENLIQNYSDMISEYENYLNDQKLGSSSIEGITARQVTDPVLSSAVIAIIAYFDLNRYYLSSELLSYAKNTSTGNTYNPYNGFVTRSTAEYTRLVNQIRSSGTTSGSGSSNFNKTGTYIDKDLYYAIHGYSYTYKTGKLTITDKYDFALNKDYEGLAGTAVNTMYMAQQKGVIVPFYVNIALTY